MATKSVCSIPDCGKRVKGYGYCLAHYKKFARYGDPLAGYVRAKNGEVLAWLESHINDTSDECLIWPFGKGRNGYGAMAFRGQSNVSPSRVMCFLVKGEPSRPNMQAAHSCRGATSGCCSPKHVRWATPIENNADKWLHGTIQLGEKHHHSKVTETQVRAIRNYARNGVKNRAIADHFCLKIGHVRSLVKRQSWKWLP